MVTPRIWNISGSTHIWKEDAILFYIGLEGSMGCDLELLIIRQTDKAYQLDNQMGNIFRLPKSSFD